MMNRVVHLSIQECSYSQSYCDENQPIHCEGCGFDYCSAHHKAIDQSPHLPRCSSVRSAQAKVLEEKHTLMDRFSLMLSDGCLFDDSKIAWAWHDIGSFVQSQYELIHRLLELRTQSAVESALRCAMDSLRINRSDNLGLRFVAPILMARIGRDQEAFDFLVTNSKGSSHNRYSWSELDLPVLQAKKEDVSQNVESLWANAEMPLFSRATIILLKLKLLFNLRDLENTAIINESFPKEISDLIRQYLSIQTIHTSPIILRDVKHGGSLRGHLQSLQQQLNVVFDSIHNSNVHFWRAILKADYDLCGTSYAVSEDWKMDTQLTFQTISDSWAETPGALQWVKDMLIQRNVAIFV